MASLADLTGTFAPQGPEAGFTLADLAVQGGVASAQAGLQKQRILRNFQQFDLPDLINAQAARGAFASGATGQKAARLVTGTSDRLADIDLALAPTLASIAANQQLAGSGFLLGQSGV